MSLALSKIRVIYGEALTWSMSLSRVALPRISYSRWLISSFEISTHKALQNKDNHHLYERHRMAKVDMIAIILCKSSRQTYLAIAIPASLGMLTHLPAFNWARVLVASNFMRNFACVSICCFRWFVFGKNPTTHGVTLFPDVIPCKQPTIVTIHSAIFFRAAEPIPFLKTTSNSYTERS